MFKSGFVVTVITLGDMKGDSEFIKNPESEKMSNPELLQRLEDELRRTNEIIGYLEYLLMTKKAWKRETEFKIAELQSSAPR